MELPDDLNAELERAVAARTLELEIRNALLKSLGSSEDDDEAYSAVVESLIALPLLGIDSMAVVFYDELNLLRAAVHDCGTTVIRNISSSEEDRLERAAAASTGLPTVTSMLFSQIRYPIVFRLVAREEGCGFVVVGRNHTPFPSDIHSILEKAFASFSVQALMRKRQSHERHVRREAEKALRKSEERLRTFFAESRDMIYSSNADDVVAYINNAGLALLGVSDRFEVVGRPFADHVLSPGDRENFLKRIRSRGYVVDYECVFRRRDGSTVFCLESATAVKDALGDIIEIQGIVKDISDRIASERELWKANLELAEANEALKRTKMLAVQQEKLASIGQLAAGVAHEINNPLGFLNSNHRTMTSFLKSLRSACLEARARFGKEIDDISERYDLDFIFGEVDSLISESDEGFRRIIDIVQNLKSFARIDSSQTMSPYNVNEGLKSTLVVARNEIKYVAEVELDLHELPTIPALGGEVNQVFLNILVNAAQAIESQKRRDKGRIRISTGREGDRVVVTIADDGPGIPDDIKLKVFDPFFTTKEPGKGTGLGLALSYDIIVRKHGGSLSVADSPSKGAQFRIELPISAAGELK